MRRARAARYAAPLALVLALVALGLLVRSGLRQETPARTSSVVAVTSGPQIYVVRRGDTLDAIAIRFGTTASELARLNPGIDPIGLRVGRRIRVK